MIDYTQKFRLDKKTVFVVGGAGLIGSEISLSWMLIRLKAMIF